MTYKHKGFYNPDTEEKFKKIVAFEYDKLLKNDSLIFENTLNDYSLNTDKLFDEFYYDKNGYGKMIQESNDNKTYFIKNYFYNKTIIPAFEKLEESILENQLVSLEENTSFNVGFSTELKIENTQRYLIENFILNDFPKKQRDELTEAIIFASRLNKEKIIEDVSLPESLALTESIDINKNIAGRTYDKISEILNNVFIGGATGLARTIKEALLFGIVLFYSPYQFIGSSNLKYKILGRSGTSRIGKAIELLSPTRAIGEMLFKPYAGIGEILKKVNELDNQDIKDFIQEVQKNANTRETIINDCWLKNARTIPTEEKQQFKFSLNTLADFFKTGRMRWLGNPQDSGTGLLGFLFSIDSNDPSFQKTFFEFRKCVYEHLFDLIVGYAKIAMAEDITTTSILEKVKIASRRKDYTIFNHIKTDGRDINDLMYKVGKVLLSIEEIAESLKEHKQELFQDKYLDQFYMYLKQKIKQAYLDIDEAAEKQRGIIDNNKLKDSISRNEMPKYEESWKDHSLKNVRDYEKGNSRRKKIKSIYD